MENREEDNIYLYQDDELNDAPNFANNEEDEGQNENSAENYNKPAIGILFNIMLNPVQGWKNLRRSKISAEKMQSGCFYPLLAILSVSIFAEYFYISQVSLSELVTKALVAFVSYFFGFFSAVICLKMILRKEVASEFETDFGKNYLLTGMSTLALFSIVTNLLPMLWPILIFLPLWTIYILFKGVRFFHLAEKDVLKFVIYTNVAIIGFPYVIEWLLNLILPY